MGWRGAGGLATLVLIAAACGGDGSDAASGGGGAGAGGLGGGATATVAGPVAVSSSAATSSSASTSAGGGTGGAGGAAGGEPGRVCTDEPLPGAGGCEGGGGPSPDDCTTVENEGCTTRALCGEGAPPFPLPAGPSVAFAQRASTIGTVDGDLAFTPLLEGARLLATSSDGRAVATRPGGPFGGELLLMAADGSFDFQKAMSSTYTLYWAAVSPNGAVTVTSQFPDDLYAEDLDVTGEGTVALARIGPSGQSVWGRRYATPPGHPADFEIRAIAAAGNDVVIVGRYEGDFSLGPFPLPPGEFGFVARIDGTNGDVEWAEPVGLPHGGAATAVTVTPEGDIVVAGLAYAGQFVFTGGSRGVLLRLDGSGNGLWETRTEGPDDGGVRHAFKGVASTPSGIVATGSFSTVMRLGGRERIPHTTSTDAMVVRVDDRDGSVLSLRTWGGTSLEDPRIGADESGELVVAFCDRVVVGASLSPSSLTDVEGHTLVNPGEGTSLVMEMIADGDVDGDVGTEVCEDWAAFCTRKVVREIECGREEGIYGCLEHEECFASMVREDVACAERECAAGASCDVDCDAVALGSALTPIGAQFEEACEAAIGLGCGDFPPLSCEQMAHRHSDDFLTAITPCADAPRSCLSAGACMYFVDVEWRQNPAGCEGRPPLSEAVCDDEVAYCAGVVARNAACNEPASDTIEECEARRADFQATYRDEVECVVEACFAQAPCEVDCRDRVLLVAPSELGEAFIEACVPVTNCSDLFSSDCIMIGHTWPDDRLAAALPCFDGGASCDDAADCLGDVASNAWWP